MLKRFEVDGYRNLSKVDLTLGRLQVVVGPNNSGKSNLIGSMEFLPDMLKVPAGQIALPQVLSAHGARSIAGGPHVRWHYQVDDVEYSAVIAVPDRPDRWHTASPVSEEVRQAGGGRTFRRTPNGFETHGFGHEGGNHPGTLMQDSFLRQERAVVQATVSQDVVQPAFWLAAQETFERFASGFASYHAANFDPRHIKTPQPSDSTTGRLDNDAGNLANALRFVEQDGGDGLEPTRRLLAEAIRDLRRIWIKDSGGTHRWIALKVGDQNFDLGHMSDGTVQMLVMAYLLSTSARMSMLCIDEPELNLHPAWVKLVGQWLLRARSADQILVCTHSPDLLDVFTEAFQRGECGLIVFTKPGEARSVQPAELEPFFKDGWELGDLYRVGEPALGGWPW